MCTFVKWKLPIEAKLVARRVNNRREFFCFAAEVTLWFNNLTVHENLLLG